MSLDGAITREYIFSYQIKIIIVCIKIEVRQGKPCLRHCSFIAFRKCSNCLDLRYVSRPEPVTRNRLRMCFSVTNMTGQAAPAATQVHAEWKPHTRHA